MCIANYAWSFKDRSNPASFFQEALEWFGRVYPAANSPAPFQVVNASGELSVRIKSGRTLLILDSLETLQEGPGSPKEGRFIGKDIQALVGSLASGQRGLCVITSQHWPSDLGVSSRKAVRRIDLGPLSEDDGTELLGLLETEPESERLATVREYQGNALCLYALAAVLRAVRGNLLERQKIDISEHADLASALSGLVPRLTANARAVLRLLSLADGPADSDSLLKVFRQAPIVKGLNDVACRLSDREWRAATVILCDIKLVVRRGEDGRVLEFRHDGIRRYFASTFKAEDPAAWLAGQERLYRKFCRQAEDVTTGVAPQLDHIYKAIFHGCEAGLHEEVFKDVIWSRLHGGQFAFKKYHAGAVSSSDVLAVRRFFTTPYHPHPESLMPEIRDHGTKANVLSWAGETAQLEGNLEQALTLWQAALEAYHHSGDSDARADEAFAAGYLARVLSTIGHLDWALERIDHCLKIIDQHVPAHIHIRMLALCLKGHILYEAGRYRDALATYRSAHELIPAGAPAQQYSDLFLVQTMQYCEVLSVLAPENPDCLTELKGIMDRIAVGPVTSLAVETLRSFVGGQLALAQAARSRQKKALLGKALALFDAAVGCFQREDVAEYRLRVLLARAEVLRGLNKLKQAAADVREAQEMARRRGFGLRHIDSCLEYARLHLAQGYTDKAKQSVKQAQALLRKYPGYGPGEAEMERLRRQLG